MNNSEKVPDDSFGLSKVGTFIRKNDYWILPTALGLGIAINTLVNKFVHDTDTESLRKKEQAEEIAKIEKWKGLILQQFSAPGCTVKITDTSQFLGVEIEAVKTCTVEGVTGSLTLKCNPKETNHFGGILCERD